MMRVNASTSPVGGLYTELIKYILAIFHISIFTLSNTVDDFSFI